MKPWTRNWPMFTQKADLNTEHEQCRDEGKDLAKLEPEFQALHGLDLENDMDLQARAGKLFDRTVRLRPKAGHAFKEPSDLASIRKARRKRVKLPAMKLDDGALSERALGGWLGRSAGCTLGKEVEGRHREQIEGYLKAQGRWPLTAYFSNQISDELRKQFNFNNPAGGCYIENLTCMCEDDDMNYTTTGLAIVEKFGKNFKPSDVGEFWLGNIPLFHTCTAERVAYRNLSALVPPPNPDGTVDGKFSSATYRNPYREWIGAQIRADFFGYVNPGDTERAAEFAWRDACISHIKNGIYGEMWVAAMLAAAYVIPNDVEKVIRAGMGEIPYRSRLHADLTDVLNWRAEKVEYWDAVDRIHKRWNQHNPHHWCHTNSNAQIVAIALLWGEMDFGSTICKAVMPGFDTDCNGATAGSVLGVMLGGGRIPEQWAAPLNDTLETGVAGYYKVRLSDMAAKTVELIRRES